MFTYIETAGQTELKQCDYMIQGDHEAIYLKHRPWNITASTPNAIVNYLCWAQFSLRFWHFWWVSSLFQWLPTISKPVLSISLIVGRLYIRISLTTRENTLVARDGEGFMEVAMLLHVLMFWGLLARPAGRSDWPAENYPVRTWRVMRKAGAARRRLAEKLNCFGTIFPNLNFVFASIWAASPVHIESDQYRSCSTVKQGPAVSATPSTPIGEQPKTALWLWVCEITCYLYTRWVHGRMKTKQRWFKVTRELSHEWFLHFRHHVHDRHWTGEFATVIWRLHCFTVSFRGDVRGESGPR